MIRTLSLICLLPLLPACQSEENRVAKMLTSPDGHPFAFMAITEDGVSDVTVSMAWNTDWLMDPANNPMVPYLGTDLMLRGGTTALKPQAVMELFEDKNTDATIYPRPDHVIGEIEIPNNYIKDVLPVTAEILTSPIFEDRWLVRSKAGFMEQAAQVRASSGHSMWAAVRTAILGDHPVNTMLAFRSDDLFDAVTLADVTRWHDETFTGTPAAIAVTGAISGTDAGRMVDDLLAGLPARETAPFVTAPATYTPGRILLHMPDAGKSTLGIVGALRPMSELTDILDNLALRFFIRPVDGPVFKTVRSELRASYGFSGGPVNYDRQNRFLYVSGEVETALLNDAANGVVTGYMDFVSDPDMTGFEGFRNVLATQIDGNTQGVDRGARLLIEALLDGRDLNAMTHLGDVYRKIPAGDVRAHMATAFPKARDLMIFAVSPDANALQGACVITRVEDVGDCL